MEPAHKKRPENLPHSLRQYQDKDVIFLVRDPRDVIVSLYFHQTKRKNLFSGSLSEYIYQDVGSIDTIIAYYNLLARSHSLARNTLFLRYEDIYENPVRELRKVLNL